MQYSSTADYILICWCPNALFYFIICSCRMSSAASNPSSSTSKPMPLKRNSDDIGWDYGVLVDPNNLNLIKCKLCGQEVTAGIYRFKLHIARIRGQVT